MPLILPVVGQADGVCVEELCPGQELHVYGGGRGHPQLCRGVPPDAPEPRQRPLLRAGQGHPRRDAGERGGGGKVR